MDDQNQNPLPVHADVSQDATISIPRKPRMSLGWKVAFWVLGSVLVFTVLTLAINPYELMGMPPVESQWWGLVWFLAIAPIGAVALVALLICIPVYVFSSRRADSVEKVASNIAQQADDRALMPHINSVDRWNWRKTFLVLGAVQVGAYLAISTTSLTYLDEMPWLLLAAIYGVNSIVWLALFVLLFIYILRTTRSKSKKLIAGIAIATLVLIPAAAYLYEEKSAESAYPSEYSDESPYQDQTYDDNYSDDYLDSTIHEGE